MGCFEIRRFRRWILRSLGKGAARAFHFASWVLGRIFRGSSSVHWPARVGSASRSIRYLRALGRLRRREGRIACDLGGLALAVYRQGRTSEARRVARGAFGRWRKARRVDRLFKSVLSRSSHDRGF